MERMRVVVLRRAHARDRLRELVELDRDVVVDHRGLTQFAEGGNTAEESKRPRLGKSRGRNSSICIRRVIPFPSFGQPEMMTKLLETLNKVNKFFIADPFPMDSNSDHGHQHAPARGCGRDIRLVVSQTPILGDRIAECFRRVCAEFQIDRQSMQTTRDRFVRIGITPAALQALTIVRHIQAVLRLARITLARSGDVARGLDDAAIGPDHLGKHIAGIIAKA